ncbi:unnamed protein product [Heligmosomoides polygyrus]|uniref:SEC63 domain-containing protein n=1 Tax=Heligmosomoides polygyrus TaxID=6339 RepID=A0A183GW16_HELPZ|nr:unnamed protein product [Heligmosomoides polygyrus]
MRFYCYAHKLAGVRAHGRVHLDCSCCWPFHFDLGAENRTGSIYTQCERPLLLQFHHPIENFTEFRQLGDFLRVDLIEKVERRKLTESQLLDLSAKELGYMFSCDGEKLYQAMRMLPRVEVDAVLKPITYTIMQVSATVTPAFIWNDRLLGKTGAQSFWLTLENIDENLIIHQEKIAINKKKVRLICPSELAVFIIGRLASTTNTVLLKTE